VRGGGLRQGFGCGCPPLVTNVHIPILL
jgi:hypothetical protein